MAIIDGYDVDGEFRQHVTWVEGGYEVDGEFRKDVPRVCYCTDCEIMLDAFERDTHDCATFCMVCEEQSTKREFELYHGNCTPDQDDDSAEET